jgi:hypothetical protein
MSGSYEKEISLAFEEALYELYPLQEKVMIIASGGGLPFFFFPPATTAPQNLHHIGF